MTNLPTGTVTFLFTDIEGSTKLAQEHPDQWDALRKRHDDIMQCAIDEHNGYVFKTIGDAFCAAFHTAGDALHAAITAQMNLHAEAWGNVIIKARMGVHTGKADILANGDYNGYATLSRLQRLMSAGHGGQTLISQATQELIRDELPQGITLRYMGERRLKDLIHPEHIYQVNIPSLPAEFPALKTLDSKLNNLPAQMTSFIGRKKEVEQIKKRLGKNRLVTLTGSGGIGKTRLSIQVAYELLNDYPVGIWLVELASLTDPALLPQSVCTVLGVTPEGNTSALDALTDYLRSKKILLVVDNCEHLIDACAQLCDSLLHACTDLRIIASSREALGIEGENAYRVPSLSLPDSKSGLHTILESESVKLFMERASAVFPEFEITEINAPAIAQICQRLDGIALAIELAASRVKMLKVEQIASRLDDAFRLLTGGSRTALPRQQTLRALIDWSYNLLLDEEQILLRRLSVFMGGWTLEAAEAVCKNSDMLNLLTNLVDKSLVIVEWETGDEPRYQLLETIRQYAREKLFESGEGEILRQQHADWFLKMAEQASQENCSSDDTKNDIAWLNRFESDLDNFRASLEWLFGTERIESGTRLASWLEYFWWGGDHFQEGRCWLEIGLSHPEKLPRDVFAQALNAASLMVGRAGDYNKGISYAEQSVAIFRELDKRDELADALHVLAVVSSENGDDERSNKHYLEALTLYRELGNKNRISTITIELGWEAALSGDFAQGFSLLEDGMKLVQESGILHNIAYSQFVFGVCRWMHHEPDESAKLLRASLRALHELNDIFFTSTCIIGLAGVAGSRKQFTRAAQLIGAADAQRDKMRFTDPPFWMRDIKGPILDVIHAQLNEAEFDKAWNKGYAMDMEQAIAFALEETSD